MTPEDYGLIAQLCSSHAGLEIDARKTYLIDSRLGPVARRDGFGSIEELVDALRQRQDERMVWAVVEAMAVGETLFFRDRSPFELFTSRILPALAKARKGEPIRVWSAACASGQEVYSLAMGIDEVQGDLGPGASVELFGSDISERALEKAQSGIYTQFEIQRGLPIRRLVRHFEKADENWQLSPQIRQMVRWRRINLIAETPASGRFDVVFCRYVLATMTDEARFTVLANLARALRPGGFLVLGQGESNLDLGDGFLELPGIADIRRRDPAHSVAA